MVLNSHYEANGVDLFMTNVNLTVTQNLKKIGSSVMNTDFALLEKMLNIQYEIASVYLPYAVELVNYEAGLLPILVSTFYKNLFAFYATFDLTKKGLYGPARLILRYLYESVTIAKFCSISLNCNLIQRWNEGNHINLSNDVLNKIKSPDNTALKLFLKPLNSFVHPTIYAQQTKFNVDENWDEINFNIGLLKVLLECNYHVFNRFVLNGPVIYYIKTYGSKSHDTGIKLKKELRKQFSISKINMLSENKKIIQDFTQSWLI
jgi:hypothetical protein